MTEKKTIIENEESSSNIKRINNRLCVTKSTIGESENRKGFYEDKANSTFDTTMTRSNISQF